MKTILHNATLKYVDFGETRVVTNSKYIAEQVKSDRAEKVVTNGPKVVKGEVVNGRKIWKSCKRYGEQRDRWTKVEGHRQTVKNVASDGRKVGKFRKKAWKALRQMESTF